MSIAAVLRRNIFYPLWLYKNRDHRLTYLKKYEKLQYWSEKELKRLQFTNLKKILSHAYKNTTHYKRTFDRVRFDPKKLNDFSQLQKLPILTKNQIQSGSDQLIAKNYRKEPQIKFKTGGSTGKALTVYSNRDRLERGVAAAYMCFRWAGWKIGEPMARVWGNPPIPITIKERLKNFLIEPIIWLDTMDLNESSMLEFVKKWEKVKPALLHGHAHSLFIFAEFLRKRKIDILKPKGIISTSMMLTLSERSVIEDVFGIKVINLYGCEEVGLIACECYRHEGMHLNVLNSFIEFVKSDGSAAKPGEEGEIVVTSLTNYGMPLIRYRIEDIGIPTNHLCSCGRGFPLMQEVTGRVADFLVKQDGGLVAGISLIERTLTKIAGLTQMQIIQEDMKKIHLSIVKNKDYSEKSRIALLNEFRGVFGPQVTVHIDLVSEIRREKSGKYRFSICKVKY